MSLNNHEIAQNIYPYRRAASNIYLHQKRKSKWIEERIRDRARVGVNESERADDRITGEFASDYWKVENGMAGGKWKKNPSQPKNEQLDEGWKGSTGGWLIQNE